MTSMVSVARTGSLLNRNFVASCCSNLLFYTSVYMLIPVLPLYLVDVMHTGKSVTGIILSSFTIAALAIRPFSGVLVDCFQRKPLYMVFYFCFAVYFVGYLLATTLVLLLVVRCTHGVIFGIASTSASTLAIDTLPPEKLGRGIGIYGTTTSLAMSLGPMAGLMLQAHFSYQMVFVAALIMAVIAFCVGSVIHSEPRKIVKSRCRFTFKTAFLATGLPLAVCLSLPSFLYGEILNYLSLYAVERGIATNPGFFFSLLAIGMVLSRLFSGKLIDGGLIIPLVIIGKAIAIVAVLLFVFVPQEFAFFGSALLTGIGFGIIFPTYQTIFIRLASREQRGMANSTYLTACDFGIGIAIFFGGMLAELLTFPVAFLTGALFTLLSIMIFTTVGVPYFWKHQVVQEGQLVEDFTKTRPEPAVKGIAAEYFENKPMLSPPTTRSGFNLSAYRRTLYGVWRRSRRDRSASHAQLKIGQVEKRDSAGSLPK